MKTKPINRRVLPTAVPKTTEHQWYAIYTKSRFEKKLYKALQKLNAEVFLPLKKEERIWSDRIKKIETPLIPGYVFVKLKNPSLSKMYFLPGFVRFVSEGGKPAAIKQFEIDILNRIICNDVSVYKLTNCKKGNRVRVKRGPLKGIIGEVNEIVNDNKIFFFLESIKQSICVEISKRDIELL